MERREAIKNLGLSFGFMITAPTVMSILQSCEKEEAPWIPVYFTEQEGIVLKKVVDIILPSSEDTPGALDVNVPQFIDKFVNEVVADEERDMAREFMGIFTKKALADSGKEDMSKLKDEDIEPIIAASLKKTKEQEEEIFKTLGEHVEALTKGESSTLPDDIAIYSFLSNIRGLSIWAYKNSQYVGTEVLAYSPIPGKYVGCVDLQETTGGRDWSIW